MKRLFLLVVAALSSLSLQAQTTKHIVANSYQDVSFGAGMYMNSRDKSLQYGTVYSLDYAQFAYNNIGFRGGVSYIDQLGNGISMVGVPLRFAWRSGIDRRTMQERFEASTYSLIAGDGDVASALINLSSMRFEISGGVTPMFAASRGGTTYGWGSMVGDFAEELSVKSNFALSADIAGRLSIRVWRFNLFFEPQYHYWLTDNFTYQFKTEGRVESSDMNRSYLSMLLGVNFIL